MKFIFLFTMLTLRAQAETCMTPQWDFRIKMHVQDSTTYDQAAARSLATVVQELLSPLDPTLTEELSLGLHSEEHATYLVQYDTAFPADANGDAEFKVYAVKPSDGALPSSFKNYQNTQKLLENLKVAGSIRDFATNPETAERKPYCPIK